MPIKPNRPIRILHVVASMNRGGIETWLMHVLRHIDREKYRIDFLVNTSKSSAYDEEIRDLGSAIVPCLVPSQPWRYAMNFARATRQRGPYTVVHSHVHHFSGFVLWCAQRAGIPIRIAHSHSDTSLVDSKATLLRKVYLKLTKHLIRRYATVGLAASEQAAKALYGPEWLNEKHRQIHFCAVDLQPFEESINAQTVREELGISKDAFVVGHVGRFSEAKNHRFLLDIAKNLIRKDPNIRFVLVGDGPLRAAVESKVVCLGLSNYVKFVGLRDDVPRLMLGSMDAFILPSLYEGLGLVLIEAQAAGLPCFISHVIPKEADVVQSLIKRLSLSDPAEVWGDALLTARRTPRMPARHALHAIKQSPFNIVQSVRGLEKIYHG